MPWDPVRDLLTMQERLESLFGRAAPGWVPAVDLFEGDDRYVLMVELPGMRREDVTIEVQADVLVLRGERPGPSCPDRYQQLECGQGPFSRSFRFAQIIRADGVTADLADGILTIVAPKTAASNLRHVEIS